MAGMKIATCDFAAERANKQERERRGDDPTEKDKQANNQPEFTEEQPNRKSPNSPKR